MSALNTEKWNNIKERGGMLPLLIMLAIYRFGGRWLCRFVLYFIILWYWLFSKIAREASLLYLSNLHQFAQEKSPFSKAPSLKNTYHHLMAFGECILDKIEGWLGHIPEHQLELHGHEHFREHYQKGAILLVSHFGNIELLRAVKSEHVQKVNILVYQKHATKFNQFLKKLNKNVDVNLIAVDELGVETAMILEEKLAQGEWIIIAADRTPVESNRVQHISFLGEIAAWPQGAWILANLLKVPVLAVFCYRKKEKIQVHIHSIAAIVSLPRQGRLEAMKEFTQKFIALLEYHCMQEPYQWFNFYKFWNK